MDESLCSVDLVRVRTLTAFINLSKEKETWNSLIVQYAGHLNQLKDSIETLGYGVQTLRLVTNPFPSYLDTSSPENALKDMAILADILQSPEMPKVRIRFALGATDLESLPLVPILIQKYGDLANICLNVTADDLGIPDEKLSRASAEIIKELSTCTPRGEGNFNFTVNYNCPPLIPYFPASYHLGDHHGHIVLGFETPDLLLKAIQSLPLTTSHNQHRRAAYNIMSKYLQYHVDQVVPLARKYCAEHSASLTFSGVDSSAAPSHNCASMVDLYQALGVPFFGAAGSLEVSALLTRVFKSITGTDLVGFSGLMLAATEDKGLARDAAAGLYDIRTFLANSAVCGIGLDTVPVPGDVTTDQITFIMQDTGTLAYRLSKPLTVRLFPVPGKVAGEITDFTSPDLCNCGILAIPF